MSAARKPRSARTAVAILCSDMHLSATPPVARSGEPDWYAAMGRVFDQIQKVRSKVGIQTIPIICAGDVFHHWRSPPELINFALDKMPVMYAIPGQHDMPMHNRDLMHKSAFETLVRAERIIPLDSDGLLLPTFDILVRGFGFGEKIIRHSDPRSNISGITSVCVAHQYVWTKHAPRAISPVRDELDPDDDRYHGYDVVVFGDNHKPFFIVDHPAGGGVRTFFNCGSTMRRSSDDKHIPRVGVVYDDKTVESVPLDISADHFNPVKYHFNPVKCGPDPELEVAGFLAKIQFAYELDYSKALRAEFQFLSPEARRIILEALECD